MKIIQSDTSVVQNILGSDIGHLFLKVSILLFLFSSCAPTEAVREKEPVEKEKEEYTEVYPEKEPEEKKKEENEALYKEDPALAELLDTYRSRFSDQWPMDDNKIPEPYVVKEKPGEKKENEVQSHRGFRIQILSTQDARFADEILEDFEDWIRSVSAPPWPQGYIRFQQPYYRVQVGDFADREKAMEFSEFLRLRYRDAWVIHSRIHPGRVIR